MLCSTCFGDRGRYFKDIKQTDIDPDYLPVIAGATNPKNRFVPVPIATLVIDDGTSWTDYQGTSTDDAVNVMTSDNASGSHTSVKFTKTATDDVNSFYTLDLGGATDYTTPDGSDPFVYVRFYIHDGSGNAAPSTISTVQLRIGDNGLTNRWQYNFWQTTSASRPTVGWYEYMIPMSAFDPTATPTFTDIQDIRFTVITTANAGVPVITLDTIAFYPPLKKAVYMLTMDDGNDGIFEVASYLSSKGMRGTFFITTEEVGETGRVTLAQLKAMKKAGHLIANHTNSFDTLDGLTSQQIADRINKATDWLCANGFADGARVFASVGGYWNQDLYDDILGKHIDFVRLTQPLGTIANSLGNDVMWTRPDVLFSSASEIPEAGDIADWTDDALTVAVADKAACIINMHHEHDELYTHIDNVKTQVDLGTIEVITPLDLINREAELWGRDETVNGNLTIVGALNYAVTATGNDTYTATIVGIRGYRAGMVIYLNPDVDNTGACTLNINALGAKSLKTVLGNDPGNSHIDAAQIVPLVYDGTNFVILTPDSNP